MTNSRVSLAGACMDLAVDLIEGCDGPGVGPWLESWRDDVAHHSHGYRHDMVAARGGVAYAASWSLAFCRLNFELIDELAMMLVRADVPVDYAALAARFRGRTVDVDHDALQAPEVDFAGQTLAREGVDEAVADYLAADGTKYMSVIGPDLVRVLSTGLPANANMDSPTAALRDRAFAKDEG